MFSWYGIHRTNDNIYAAIILVRFNYNSATFIWWNLNQSQAMPVASGGELSCPELVLLASYWSTMASSSVWQDLERFLVAAW